MIEIVTLAGAVPLGELKSGLYVVAEKYIEGINLTAPFNNITIFLRSPHIEASVHSVQESIQCTIVSGVQENRVGLICEMKPTVKVFPVKVIKDMQVEVITTTNIE